MNKYQDLTNRELDKLVAEQVFGLKAKDGYERSDYGRDQLICGVRFNDCDYPADNYVSEIPYYSTDISAAWLVIEKMQKLNEWQLIMSWKTNFITMGNSEYSIAFYRDGSLAVGESHHKSESRAICLAALTALDKD